MADNVAQIPPPPPVDDDDIDDDDDDMPEELHVFIPATNLNHLPFDTNIGVVNREDNSFETNLQDVITTIEYYTITNAPQVEIDYTMYPIKTFVKSNLLSEYDLSANTINIFTSWKYDPDTTSYNNTVLLIFYMSENNDIFITSMLCATEINITRFAFEFIIDLYDKIPNVNNIYLYNGSRQLLTTMPSSFEEVQMTALISATLPPDVPLIIDHDTNYVYMKMLKNDDDDDAAAAATTVAADAAAAANANTTTAAAATDNITTLIAQLQNPAIDLKYSIMDSNATPQQRELLRQLITTNFTQYGALSSQLIYVALNPTFNLIENIMIPQYNIYFSYKKITTAVNGAAVTNMYIMGLLIYVVTPMQIIVPYYATFYNPRGSDMYNNFVNLYDTFKGLLDEFTWVNNIYFLMAVKRFEPFLTNAYIGWQTAQNIAALQTATIDENYQPMLFKRAKPYPVIHLHDADFIYLDTAQGTIPSDATVFDLIEGVDMPIDDYLSSDPQNIIFITKHNNSLFYIASNRDSLKSMLFKTVEERETPDYDNILYGCKKVVKSLNFTNDDISGNTLYFNLAKIGAHGTYMVELYELLHVYIGDDNKKMYLLESNVADADENTASLISTISVSSFCKLYPDLVSSSHCQEGQGGRIYRIKNFVTNKRDRSDRSDRDGDIKRRRAM